MSHYNDIKAEYDAAPVGAFPIPISLILVALKYAMRKSWGSDDRERIKIAVLKLWGEVVVPGARPSVDGALEAAAERLIRNVLVALLDAALGPKE